MQIATGGAPLEALSFGNDEAALSDFLHGSGVSHANLHHTRFGLDTFRRAGIPSIYTLHTSYVWLDSDERRRWARALRAPDLCIAVSRQVAAFAITVLGVPPEVIQVVPNGVEVGGAPEILARGQAEFRFINVASFDPGKMQRTLLESFAAVVAGRPEARLTLLGSPTHRLFFEEVAKVSRALGLESKVEIVPGEDHALAMQRLARADCFVLPSAIEGCSLALTEAVALGLPCVATDVGSAEDLRQAGAAIRIVPALVSELDCLTPRTLYALLQEPPRRFIDGLTSGMVDAMSNAISMRARAAAAAGPLREA